MNMRTRSNILIIFCFFFFVHPADALVKRSKKDECTLCHVLWMDVFRTDQQTLLGPTQSNIVISGSVGLSSSKRICYSCHDGYVMDSRTAITEGNKHHQLKTVPDWLELPNVLRLDINNEFYCGTCHGFHDVRGMGESGNMPFMRMDNSRSEMCMACHKDKISKLGYQNHPLAKKSSTLPKEMVEKLGGKLGPDGEIICRSCHIPHKKPTLLASLKDSEICLICHSEKKTILASDHNMAITSPAIKNILGKDIAKSGPCSSCHVPHNGVGRRMWAREIDEGNAASQACLSCHVKELGIKTTGAHSHPMNVKPAKNANLSLYSNEGLRAQNGTVQCATCHDVHKWDSNGSEGYVKDMEGGSENSFLRISNKSSGLCITCHEEKKDIIGTDHDLRITTPNAKNIQGLTAVASGPCGGCHVPHNAAGPKLWARKNIPGNPASKMCLSCHGEETEHIQKTIGEHSHPIDVVPVLAKGVKNVIPLFSERGTKESSGKIQCATCHNPHRWNPNSSVDQPNKKSEGDGSNSFLRIANTRQSALCQQCHADKKQVLASDHNLLVTAPAEENIMGSTPSQSGPCSACHVPHNATGKKLWGKNMSGEKDFVSKLCFGCHYENGAAYKKRINANSHPVNVTLEHITPGGEIVTDLPLYTSEGDSGSSSNGKVVCITCHDPHSWSPELTSSQQEAQPQTNMEGNTLNSFLRKANYPDSALCTTCHQTEALVNGSPHDLTLTAPLEKNIQGQTAKKSGQCSACHLVHNSPNNLKLWARPYGPVKKNENRMNALCTSCHSRGMVAENKVQKIATHPEGIITSFEKGFIKVVYDKTDLRKVNDSLGIPKSSTKRYTPILTNNIVGFSSGRNYTPLFNNRGKEVNIGKISCPSCHNAHVRNRQQKENTAGENQINPTGGKFLRTESTNLVCIECHWPDAIFRFLFFHSQTSRAKGVNIKRQH
jgi:predicted CXXCH cytochrome family protein